MMTVNEVAEYLSVSESHIGNLIDTGDLESINVASPGANPSALPHPRESLAAFERKRRETR